MSLVKLMPSVTSSITRNVESKFEQLTISIGKVKPLIKLLAAEGVGLEELLEGTGISLRDLTLFDLSIEYEQYLRLIDNAYVLSPDPCFGLSLGEQFYVNHDGLLACRIMSSENAMQAMYLLKDYQSLLTLLFQFNFEVFDDKAVFTVHPAYRLNNSLPFFIEYTFAAIYSIGKFCLGSQKMELSYEFSYEHSASSERYTEFFGGQVRFSCKENRVLVPLEVLNKPFVFADKQTAKINDEFCQDKVCSIENEVDIKQRVKMLIRKNKLFKISLETLAEQLCMSPRTLSRQLKARNISYKTILEEERKKRAIQQIQDHDIPLDQLAEQLGYQDASSFSRAFKKWVGVPPNQFKELQD
mgnify:FL=1